MTKGYRWQDVLGHRLELSAAPGPSDVGSYWGTATWGAGTWDSGWRPPFADITRRLLSLTSSAGAQGLDLSPGVGSLEVELLDLDGALAPGGDVDWLLGHQIRLWLTPLGQVEHPAWYGAIDKVEAGGSFAVPIVSVTAYDVRAQVAAASAGLPIADQAERADTRLRTILEVARFDPRAVDVEADPSPLLPDDETDLGDLFGRTIDSVGGIAWAAGDGTIRTRNRGWTHGSDVIDLYVYAGQPLTAPPAGVEVAETSDLAASQGADTVRNHVTYANRAEPPVEVVRQDSDSIRRYGYRRFSSTDLACDEGSLELLAAQALDRQATPVLVCEGATVSVYDAATARAAGLALGDVVMVGRNDPEQAQWEMRALVMGIDLDLSPDSCEVALTLLEAGGTVAAGVARWDSATWDGNRWGSRPVLGTWHLGPSSSDALDAGYVLA